jgi:hypothetical protein
MKKITARSFLAVALFLLSSLCRADQLTTYSFNLDPGTSRGTPITNMMIFETNVGGSQLLIDYGGSPNAFTVNGTGFSTLSHTSTFTPAMSLIVGLVQQAEKVSLVIFMNNAFAANASGLPYNRSFSSVNHPGLINHVLQAGNGVQSDLDWFRDVFFPIDGWRAAFATGGSFTAMEFTTGIPIGRVPEQSGTLLLLAVSCASVLALHRWKSVPAHS